MNRKTTIASAILFVALTFLAAASRAEQNCQTAAAPVSPNTYLGNPVNPLFRYNIGTGNHFYTTDWNEMKGCGYENFMGYVLTNPAGGRVALHRLWWNKPTPSDGNHFYTTNQAEADEVKNLPEFRYERIEGYVLTTAQASTRPLHRLYLGARPDHFYTASQSEADNFVASQGYKYEATIGHLLVDVITVPDVAGINMSIVESNLMDLGLGVNIEWDPTPSGVTSGRVRASNPASGTLVRSGSLITIYIGQ